MAVPTITPPGGRFGIVHLLIQLYPTQYPGHRLITGVGWTERPGSGYLARAAPCCSRARGVGPLPHTPDLSPSLYLYISLG